MASIEEEIKQNRFSSEQTKAHINVLFTAHWLNNKTSAILKPFNLSPEQFNVLRILRGQHRNAMCQKDILSRMIARQSNLTLIIKKLKEKKLIGVKTSPLDKREYQIAILNEGLKTLNQIDTRWKTSDDFQMNLNTSEAFHLNALLDQIRMESK